MRKLVICVGVLLTVAVSCSDATQVNLIARTNVPFESGHELGVWASHSGESSTPVLTSKEPWGADGRVGNVVITPQGSRSSDPLSLRVTLGLRGKPAAACTDAAPADCIITRRRLAFVPKTRLTVPIVLYNECVGVACDENSTCAKGGACVSAAIEAGACATAAGCALAGDELPIDAGVPLTDTSAPSVPEAGPEPSEEAGPGPEDDAGTDTGTDAGIDTGTDAGVFPLGARLASGDAHNCLVQGGAIKCWGAGIALGLGDPAGRGDEANELGVNLPVTDLGPGRTVIDVVAAGFFTCARLDNSSLKCWGFNSTGQLGLGDLVNRGDQLLQMGANLPAVDLGQTVLGIALGERSACALLGDRSVKCWGQNTVGQLGLGDGLDRGGAPGQMGAALPSVNLGGRPVVQIASRFRHTCARFDDGTVKCWGENVQGQLGYGDTINRGTSPAQLGGALPVVDLGPGRTAVEVSVGNLFSCARLDNGGVKCWGGNGFGYLGQGDVLTRGDAPGQLGAALPQIDLGPGRTAVQICSGGFHSCARLDDASLKCWGRNGFGALGLGDSTNRGVGAGQMGASLPAIDLGPGRTAAEVRCGERHVCTRLDDGSVKCWGYNNAGQLGLGNTNPRGGLPGEMGAGLPVIPLF